MTGKEKRESSSSSRSRTSSSSSSANEEDLKPSDDLVLNKYKMAGEIVNKVLKELVASAKHDVPVSSLCSLGDSRMLELVGQEYKAKKDIQKGIAMPTCVSINNCICHYSPLSGEPEVTLVDGQMVKFDIGVHLDGFIATGAHTMVVGATEEKKVDDKKARVILAAYNSMELILRMLRPDKGFKNIDVTSHVTDLCKSYNVAPIENMLSHEMNRFKIDGVKQIIQNPSDDQKSKMEKVEFENYDVFAIDVLVSTGEGKAKPLDTRTTVYKKTDETYQLKIKSSRIFYSEVQQKFGSMPFTLRNFENQSSCKMGVVECERHGLLQPYPVLYEAKDEFVAQFKTTAIITPQGIHKITGLPLETQLYSCDVKIGDKKLAALLQEGLKPKKKKPNTVKKGAATDNGEKEEAKNKEAEKSVEKVARQQVPTLKENAPATKVERKVDNTEKNSDIKNVEADAKSKDTTGKKKAISTKVAGDDKKGGGGKDAKKSKNASKA